MITSITPTIGQVDKAFYEGEDKSGADTRYNLCEIRSKLGDVIGNKIEQQARSVACLVQSNFLESLPFSTDYKINKAPTLADNLKTRSKTSYKSYCEKNNKPFSERTQFNFKVPFQNELSLACGTAFLVEKQLVLTAAHCILDDESKAISKEKIDNLKVLFGFHIQSDGQVKKIFESKDVYCIKNVYHYGKDQEIDWALLTLDREVQGRDPLCIAASQEILKNTYIYMIGYPLGLPLKITLSGRFKKDCPRLFEVEINAFGGNSGSPVFEYERGSVVGMLMRGQIDFFFSHSTNKHVVNVQIRKISENEANASSYESCLKIDFIKTHLFNFKNKIQKDKATSSSSNFRWLRKQGSLTNFRWSRKQGSSKSTNFPSSRTLKDDGSKFMRFLLERYEADVKTSERILSAAEKARAAAIANFHEADFSHKKAHATKIKAEENVSIATAGEEDAKVKAEVIKANAVHMANHAKRAGSVHTIAAFGTVAVGFVTGPIGSLIGSILTVKATKNAFTARADSDNTAALADKAVAIHTANVNNAAVVKNAALAADAVYTAASIRNSDADLTLKASERSATAARSTAAFSVKRYNTFKMLSGL